MNEKEHPNIRFSMKRRKSGGFIFYLIGIIGMVYIFSWMISLIGFSRSDEIDLRQNLHRAIDAVSYEIDRISIVAKTKARENETSEFIDGKNPQYVRTDLNDYQLSGAKLNFYIYLNDSGRIIWETGFDLNRKKRAPIPESLKSQRIIHSLFRLLLIKPKGVKGILLADETPLLVAIQPIRDNGGSGSTRGALIGGVYLDKDEISRLQNVTLLPLELSPYDRITKREFARSSDRSTSDLMIARPLDSKTNLGIVMMEDLFGRPALEIRIKSPRSDFIKGEKIILLFILSMAGIGFIISRFIERMSKRLELSEYNRKDIMKRFQMMIERTSEGIILIEENSYKIIEANAVLKELIGFSDEDLSRLTLYDLLLNPKHEVNEFIESGLLEERKEPEEFLCRRMDDDPIAIELSAHALQHHNHRLVYIIIRDIRKRKKALDALRDNEEKYRRIVEMTHEGVWILDTKGNFTFVNHRMSEMLGYETHEMIGQPCYDFIDKDERRKVQHQLIHRKYGKQGDYELKFIRKDGAAMWGWISSTPLWDDAGAYAGVQGMLIDITRRKKIEETLRSVVTRARCILWSATIERAGNGFNWSLAIPDEEAAQNIVPLDLSPGQNYAQAWVESRHPDDVRSVDRMNESALLRGDNGYCQEFRCVDKDGELIWLSEETTLSRIGEGIWEAVGVCTDITSRKKLEDKIHRDAIRSKLLLQINQMTDASMDEIRQFTLEKLLSITESNFGYVVMPAERGDGYKAHFISNRNTLTKEIDDFEIILNEAEVNLWMNYLENKRTISENELSSIALKTLLSIWGEITEKRQLHAPIREGSKLIALAGIARTQHDYGDNDTEHLIIMLDGFYRILQNRRSEATQRSMEIQLRHSQKMESVGQLAAGVAHEINTPIQFIGDNLQFLNASFSDLFAVLKEIDRILKEPNRSELSADAIKSLQDAYESADAEYLNDEIPKAIDQSIEGVLRVSKIVRALKEFSHPDRPEKTPTDLNKALENAVAVSRNEWKYVAEVEFDLDPDLPMVVCFAGNINQVFLNLIINAAQAIAGNDNEGAKVKGIIRVSSRIVEDQAEIRISDNGPGIPLEIRDRIFDPFFTTKEVGKGTGQGLSIAYNVMTQMHRGSIAIEAVNTDGAAFILRLPLHEEETPKEDASQRDEFAFIEDEGLIDDYPIEKNPLMDDSSLDSTNPRIEDDLAHSSHESSLDIVFG